MDKLKKENCPLVFGLTQYGKGVLVATNPEFKFADFSDLIKASDILLVPIITVEGKHALMQLKSIHPWRVKKIAQDYLGFTNIPKTNNTVFPAERLSEF